MDINTVEGWNEHVKLSYTKELEEAGIEATEESIARYMEEQTEKAYELINILAKEAERKIESIPTYYYVGKERFETEKGALEYKKHISELGKTADIVLEMFRSSYPSDIPIDKINRVVDAFSHKFNDLGEYGTCSAIYLLGYLQGVRTERAKKRNLKKN